MDPRFSHPSFCVLGQDSQGRVREKNRALTFQTKAARETKHTHACMWAPALSAANKPPNENYQLRFTRLVHATSGHPWVLGHMSGSMQLEPWAGWQFRNSLRSRLCILPGGLASIDLFARHQLLFVSWVHAVRRLIDNLPLSRPRLRRLGRMGQLAWDCRL